jgi:hypothetical protein
MPGDTLTEVLALSSLSGKMSKRAREAAQKRITEEIWAGCVWPTVAPEAPWIVLRRQAKELREAAARGQKPRAYPKLAAELEARADKLEQEAR